PRQRSERKAGGRVRGAGQPPPCTPIWQNRKRPLRERRDCAERTAAPNRLRLGAGGVGLGIAASPLHSRGSRRCPRGRRAAGQAQPLSVELREPKGQPSPRRPPKQGRPTQHPPRSPTRPSATLAPAVPKVRPL